MRGRLWLGLVLCSLLLLAGCGSKEKDVVATVDGQPVTSAELESRVEQVKAYYRAQGVDVDTPAHQRVLQEVRQQALESLIQMRMLEKAFRQEGIRVEDAAVREQMEAMRRGMPEGQFDRMLAEQKLSEEEFLRQLRFDMQRAALYEKVTAGVEATDAEVQDFFERHQEDLVSYRLRYILAATPAGAGEEGRQQALARSKETIRLLAGGADFATLARERSDDAANREEGGLAAAQSLVDATVEPAVLQAAAGLAEGEYTREPVEGQRGYYVVLLEDRQDSFDELRQPARQAVLRDKKNQAFGEYFDRLQASTRVEVKQPANG